MRRPGVLPDGTTVARAALAIAAVALVSLLFIGSYAGALHEPTPRDVPVAVSAQVPPALEDRIDRSDAFRVVPVPNADDALREIARGDAYGAVVAGSRGIEIITAPAAGQAAAAAIAQGLEPDLRSAVADVTTRTVHALPEADARGLVGFYTVVGWIVAGYLGATFLGLLFGVRPSLRRTVWRLSGLLALAIVAGLGGAALAVWIGDTGSFGLLAVIGLLTVLASGAATTALQAALGVIGTGVAILVFVVAGNPSSGGPFPTEMLPEPWRTIGPYIPTGAAVTAFRDAAYFPDAPLGGPLLVLGAWIVAGVAAALLLARRRRGPGERDAALAAVMGS